MAAMMHRHVARRRLRASHRVQPDRPRKQYIYLHICRCTACLDAGALPRLMSKLACVSPSSCFGASQFCASQFHGSQLRVDNVEIQDTNN